MYFTDEEEKPKAQPAGSGVFDPAAFPFRACVYRIHFKNGLSGEYQGETLAANFPFDPREVHRVEEAE
jgi:hypothetical protein